MLKWSFHIIYSKSSYQSDILCILKCNKHLCISWSVETHEIRYSRKDVWLFNSNSVESSIDRYSAGLQPCKSKDTSSSGADMRSISKELLFITFRIALSTALVRWQTQTACIQYMHVYTLYIVAEKRWESVEKL